MPTETVIIGYHKATPVFGDAVLQGLRNRFAVVLRSDSPACDYMFFDAKVYLVLIAEVSRLLKAGEERVFYGDSSAMYGLDALIDELGGMDAEDRVPPDRIEFRDPSAVTCIAVTEPWAMIGGPWPYSDSYTVSFYTEKDCSEPLIGICRKLFDGDIEIVRAATEPY